MDREALAGLLDRVKAATAGNQSLAMWDAAALLVPNDPTFHSRLNEMLDASAYVDAALALVERCLLHAATVEPSINIGATRHSCILRLVEREEPFVAENLRTPALAILAATLTALLAQESK